MSDFIRADEQALLARTGSDRNFAPGSLLAIPPADASKVKTHTAVGAKIKQALVDYGGYFVDDTGSKRGGAALCMEPGVSTEVAEAYGPRQDFHIQTQVSQQLATGDNMRRAETCG